MNETDAIRLCIRDRDPRGFEFLVRKFRREAMMHAMALVQNPDDAAEVCQESFTKAFVAFPRIETMEHFYPWFYRILRNTCLNLLRRRKVAATAAAGEYLGQSNGPEPSATDDVVLRGEEQQRVAELLEQLSWFHREILSLRYYGELRYDDISRLLGIPRGTVMSRLYHARKALLDLYLADDSTDDRRGP